MTPLCLLCNIIFDCAVFWIAGWLDGQHSGLNQGHDEGITAGFSQGYQRGYQDCLDTRVPTRDSLGRFMKPGSSAQPSGKPERRPFPYTALSDDALEILLPVNLCP